MAQQGLGFALKKKQEEDELKKKGLGLPEAGYVVDGKVVTAPAGRPASYAAMGPLPGSGPELEGELAQTHGKTIDPNLTPESMPMPEGTGFDKLAHHAASGLPRLRPSPIAEFEPEPTQQVGEGGPIEAEPGAGIDAAAGGQDQASALYAPDYGGDVSVAPSTTPGAGLPATTQQKGGLNKAALNKALLVAGLTMMEKGGRSYDRPVSATSVIGQGGLAGVQQYDRDVAEQQRLKKGDIAMESSRQEMGRQPLKTEAAKLLVQKEKIAVAGAKMDLNQKNKLNKLLDALATETDPQKYADLQTRYQAMAGKAGLKRSPMQQVKEKVKIGVDELGQDVYEERTVGAFDTGTGQMSRYEAAGGRGLPGQQGKPEVPNERTTALMMANKGNKEYETEYIRRFGRLPEGY